MRSIIDIPAVLANAEELYAKGHATEEMDGCTMQEAIYDALDSGLDDARSAYVEIGEQISELYERTKDEWTWNDEEAIERAWMEFRLANIAQERALTYDRALSDAAGAKGKVWRALMDRKEAAKKVGKHRAERVWK